ncbi:MAG: DUF1801 domain-containing protein [Stenotrophomonas sp.]
MALRPRAVAGCIADDPAVVRFMAALQHPHKAGIEHLRQLLRATSPEVGEAIKWKAPSFHTHEYFATLHLRAKSGFGVILHLGANKRPAVHGHPLLEDPARLLHWLADDRAMVRFADADALASHAASFTRLVQQWLRFL